jgi:hypothetical protein
MVSPSNPAMVLIVTYEYIFYLSFDGRLGGYCWGLIPQVPWVTSYEPKIWIRSASFSDRQLRNQAPRTEYDPTTLG